MPTLYVTEPYSTLRLCDERLQVSRKKETLLDVPLLKVERIVLFGNISITAKAVGELLARRIEVSYLTLSGRYIGRLQPALTKNLPLRVAQYRAQADPVRRLEIARQFVLGKLTNMRTFLMRAARSRDDEAIEAATVRLGHAIKSARTAQDVDVARGHEGEGSRAYFSVFDKLLLAEGFRFEGRVRRPPTDPVNALLSFGYALLTSDLHSACNIVGFDPYLGFLHTDRYGRPSLALDLCEEFRPLIVDSFVLTCLNKRVLAPEDFQKEPLSRAVRLSDAARKKVLTQYEARKRTSFQHPVLERAMTYQEALEFQARILGKALQGELEQYVPLQTK